MKTQNPKTVKVSRQLRSVRKSKRTVNAFNLYGGRA